MTKDRLKMILIVSSCISMLAAVPFVELPVITEYSVGRASVELGMRAAPPGLTLASRQAAVQGPAVHPLIADWEFLTSGPTPPTQAQCASRRRRCFNPQGIQNSYNVTPLLAQHFDGNGQTIVIIDSFGSDTIRNDLHVFNNAFNLQHMCGEADHTCAAGDPTFNILEVQGSPPPVPPPANNGTGLEVHNLWALEVSLDVEWAHAVAPKANILLVTVPTAETLGVQGFPQMMRAEEFVVNNHLGVVISQSFASAEEAFNSTQSLLNLRFAFEAAKAAGVTVLASSGDTGTTNVIKEPVKAPATIPFPTVEWPASDPLVTAVGGTSLCTNPDGSSPGTVVDNTSPPIDCHRAPGQREITWNNFPTRGIPIATGGGLSHVFGRPGFQDGFNFNTMRGVPDVAYQADPFTGVLVYMTEPAVSGGSPGGLNCSPGVPCSAGWFVVGGTSSSSPQWAGLIAIANQISKSKGGGTLGYINPALYAIASNPTRYAKDFFDVTFGDNQVSSIPGFNATTGWDAVTGLGTPNAANLLPDLVKEVTGL